MQQGTPCSACVAPLSTTSLLTVEGGTALPSLQQLAAGRPRLKCDGTRAETKFRLSAKRTSPFKPTGASVHSTTGSRGVRTSGSNAGYTKFRGSVKGTDYPLHSSVPPSLPLPFVTVCHHISTGLYTKPVWCLRFSTLPKSRFTP